MSDNVFLYLLAAGFLFAAFVLLWSLVVTFIRLFKPRPGESLRSRIWNFVKCCLACLLIGGLFLAFLWPTPCRSREAARRSTCRNNLSQIARAISNYESQHGRFPPAYSVDKDGRPLHSWRVLLLPYLEQEELYKQIRLDEPWDSPHNKAVFDATGVPLIFVCPSNERRTDNVKETGYMMIVGPGTISDGPDSVRRKDVSDGTSNTIAVVEMSDSGIHWAEPRDLKADEMSYRINDPDRPCIRSRHTGIANVAFCDGSVLSLEDSIPPETIKALTTIAGGEDLRAFWESR
jgi:prepilin-type processing-associated H-X9-DG protein